MSADKTRKKTNTLGRKEDWDRRKQDRADRAAKYRYPFSLLTILDLMAGGQGRRRP